MTWEVLVPVTITFVIANVVLLLRAGVSGLLERLGAGWAARPAMGAPSGAPAASGPGRHPRPTTPFVPGPDGPVRRPGTRPPSELDVLATASPAIAWDRCRTPGCDHKRDHRRERRP